MVNTRQAAQSNTKQGPRIGTKPRNPWLQILLDQLGLSRRTRKWQHIKAEREKMSTKLWWSVLKRDNFTCHYCGRRPPDVKLHVDHVKALANGGRTVLENLVAACATCNIGKGVDEL